MTSLVDDLRRLELLPADQEAKLAELVQQFPSPAEAMRELVQRGWLSPMQANRLAQGRGQELALGPYLLLDKLGSGGMGEVYKARHRLMDRIVALKVVKQDTQDGTLGLQRFQREIKAAARLVHPNMVMAYDADQVGGVLFFVMEHIEGTDLNKLVRQRGPLPVTEACRYMMQAAQGLDHAHRHGLVHRDIKPGNIMVAGEQVKVLDLGLARFQHMANSDSPPTDLSQPGGLLGTPDFIAPEQIADSSRADIRADIYSLGCTLHYLLTGQPPFPAGNLLEKLRKHEREEPPMLEQRRPEIPPALGAAVRRMLAKDPSQRYQTPAEVAAALAPFAGKPPAAAGPVESTTLDYQSQGFKTNVLRETKKPAATIWYLGMGGGLMTVVLLALLFWPKKPDPSPPLVNAAADKNKQEIGSGKEPPPENGQEKNQKPDGLGQKPAPGDSPIKNLFPGKSRRFLGHANQVRLVAFLDEGRKLLSAAYNEIMIWDVNDDRKELKKIPAFNLWPSALSPDQKTVLARDNGYLHLCLIDVATGEKKGGFGEKVPEAPSLEFSPNGQQALSTGQNQITRLWDLAKREEIRRFEGNRACFSSTGTKILTIAGKIRITPFLWDAADGSEIQRGPEYRHTILSLALAPDERHALLGGEDSLLLLDMKTGKEVGPLKGHEGWVNAVIFSQTGQQALSGGFDKTVRLWDVAQRKELHKFTGHTSNVTALAFSPCGHYIATGANDQTVRLWALPRE